jgi:penicillin-binding protein 1A
VLKRAKDPEDGIYAAHYFVAHVKKELQSQFSQAVVFRGGLDVRTTLDTRLQRYAEHAVRDGIGAKGPEGALVAIDPRNGHVKALVGGRDYRKNKYNLATQARRQPGSSFKTFVLAAAIEEGMPPSFRIDSSSPAYIPTRPKPWVVSNSEGRGRGMITLDAATRSSVNTVFARVTWEIGAKKVARVAKRMGITTELPTYPSIALGARNVTPLEMASAYGTLATGGVHHEPVVITKVTDADGTVLFEAKKKGKRALDKEVAAATTEVLEGVITGGTATRARIGRPAAGKTGTSQNHRDVWFVGYTPQLVTAVWVGHRTEQPVYVRGSRAFGGTVCAPIWAAFMKKALDGEPVLRFPKAGPPKYNPSKFKIPVSKPPSVVGMSLDDARNKLYGQDLIIQHVYSNKKPGTVVGQSVKDDTIVLRVSKGPKPVTPKPVTPPPTDPEPPPDPGGETTTTP